MSDTNATNEGQEQIQSGCALMAGGIALIFAGMFLVFVMSVFMAIIGG